MYTFTLRKDILNIWKYYNKNQYVWNMLFYTTIDNVICITLTLTYTANVKVYKRSIAYDILRTYDWFK